MIYMVCMIWIVTMERGVRIVTMVGGVGIRVIAHKIKMILLILVNKLLSLLILYFSCFSL